LRLIVPRDAPPPWFVPELIVMASKFFCLGQFISQALADNPCPDSSAPHVGVPLIGKFSDWLQSPTLDFSVKYSRNRHDPSRVPLVLAIDQKHIPINSSKRAL
jgi:hypothetical protein